MSTGVRQQTVSKAALTKGSAPEPGSLISLLFPPKTSADTWHGQSWRNFQTSKAAVTANADNISFLIPARYSSLKQLLVTHRDADASSTSFIKRGQTCLTHANLDQYQFRVGSVLMPQSKVSAGTGTNAVGWRSEALVELLRSFHKIGSVGDGSSINLISWNRADGDGFLGTFCVGLEMESFSNKSDGKLFFFTVRQTCACTAPARSLVRCIAAS